MTNRIEAIKNYRKLISQANKESIKKEIFKDLLNEGFLHASRWFNKTEKLWDKHKTEKSKDMTTNNRLNL